LEKAADAHAAIEAREVGKRCYWCDRTASATSTCCFPHPGMRGDDRAVGHDDVIKILLQATIPHADDDWNIDRFSLLREHLESLTDEDGNRIAEVTPRDREPDADGNDPVLSNLADLDFDEVWLLAADNGNGLSAQDCAGVSAFSRRGGAVLATRDHQDLGSSLCEVSRLGAAHYFHTRQQNPDSSRRSVDDTETSEISWPNYHSGRNGDYERIRATEPVHELFRRDDSPSGEIELFPSHPHEGEVGVPDADESARVVATGRSTVTGRPFNLVVAFEAGQDDEGNQLGRAIAESSFHHFADYNWDIEAGCPSFLTEPPGDGMRQNPQALSDIHAYVRNAALWLAAA
jgi:hypothetical protein